MLTNITCSNLKEVIKYFYSLDFNLKKNQDNLFNY